MSNDRVQPADPKVPTELGSRSGPQGYANPHEGHIELKLKKFYLLTLMTRPASRLDPQFDQI